MKFPITRIIIVLLSLSALSFSYKRKAATRKDVALTATVMGQWKRMFYDSSHYYLPVTVKLTNKSFDTLTFLNMSCSWVDIYTTDTKWLKAVNENVCNHNFPEWVSLPPKGIFTANLYLLCERENEKIQNHLFRVGAHIETNAARQKSFLSDSGNITWSNAIRSVK